MKNRPFPMKGRFWYKGRAQWRYFYGKIRVHFNLFVAVKGDCEITDLQVCTFTGIQISIYLQEWYYGNFIYKTRKISMD